MTANRTATAGVGFLVESDANRLVANSASFNEGPAIVVSGQSNALLNNRAAEPGGGGFALVDTNPDGDANRWAGNVGSGNQACVD